MWFRSAVYRDWGYRVESSDWRRRRIAKDRSGLRMPEGLRPRMRWRIDYNEAVAAADAPSSRPNRPVVRQGLAELTAVAAVTAMRSGDLKAEDYTPRPV